MHGGEHKQCMGEHKQCMGEHKQWVNTNNAWVNTNNAWVNTNNAWVNTNNTTDWVTSTLASFIEEEEVGRFVLFADNLSAQESDPFRTEIASARGIAYFGLKNATDVWQPVGAGVAQVLKSLIVSSHRDWLDRDNNTDRWYGNETPYTAMECRILLTHWTVEA